MRVLETERLLLRGWLLDDLDDLYEYAQNVDVGVMQGWKPHESKEESLAALSSFLADDERWAIVLKKNNKVHSIFHSSESLTYKNPSTATKLYLGDTYRMILMTGYLMHSFAVIHESHNLKQARL